jgi:hypothetical protein
MPVQAFGRKISAFLAALKSSKALKRALANCQVQMANGLFVAMVRPAGVEPATLGLEVRRSIQLSYRRALCDSRWLWRGGQRLQCGRALKRARRPSVVHFARYSLAAHRPRRVRRRRPLKSARVGPRSKTYWSCPASHRRRAPSRWRRGLRHREHTTRGSLVGCPKG